MPSKDDLPASKRNLRAHADAALNAEAAPEDLDAPTTPIDRFFVRNNGTLPCIAGDAAGLWRLTIDGEVERCASLSLADLMNDFETVEVEAVLECAGNGRSSFVPATDGIPWGHGAVGCAVWRGVRLRDVLLACGVKATAVYVGHESPDHVIGHPGKPALSRGLPIGKALAEETLIAFAMNGEPLAPEHGFPLRVVAPGYPGSAWQKWLARLWVREREHDGARMMGTDYRLPRRPLSPGAPVDPAEFDVITDMPVKSMITHPAGGFAIDADGALAVRGFAWSGHTAVSRVEVSVDGGATWLPASLDPIRERFAWRRFHALLRPAARGPIEIAVRATDADGRTQPLEPPWNPRGYCNNAVQRISGTVR